MNSGSSFLLLAGGLGIIIVAVIISVIASVTGAVSSFIGTKGDEEE